MWPGGRLIFWESLKGVLRNSLYSSAVSGKRHGLALSGDGPSVHVERYEAELERSAAGAVGARSECDLIRRKGEEHVVGNGYFAGWEL